MAAPISAQHTEQLWTKASRRRFGRRHVIFSIGEPGDALYLVKTGHVAIRIVTEEGDSGTLAVLGPEQTFGELALLSGGEQSRSATAETLEPTEALVLTRAQLDLARRDGLPVDGFLLDLVAASVHRLTRQLTEALYVPVRHRVVRTLLGLCDSYPTIGDSTSLLVTQDDLAGLAGATRPTVNQVLQTLEAAGAIRLHRGRIEVTNQSELLRRRG